MLASADTLLTLIETSHPECAAQISAVRQQAYVPLVNASIGALNAGATDSASATAQRALMIYKKSPYVYNVLAGVAVKKTDYPTAQQEYRQVIAVAGNDTLYKKLKTGAMYNLAVVTTSAGRRHDRPGQEGEVGHRHPNVAGLRRGEPRRPEWPGGAHQCPAGVG